MYLSWKRKILCSQTFLHKGTDDLKYVGIDSHYLISDLENPETFRDLSKPVGALNPERLERMKVGLIVFFYFTIKTVQWHDESVGCLPVGFCWFLEGKVWLLTLLWCFCCWELDMCMLSSSVNFRSVSSEKNTIFPFN